MKDNYWRGFLVGWTGAMLGCLFVNVFGKSILIALHLW